MQLVNASGVVVGAAEAECTWEEEGWATRPSNALRSMAQTRAIGKAYRGVFAFVMALAGYVPTPAEEMPDAVPQPPDLHSVPDGYDPEKWAKQVAFYLAGGRKGVAKQLYEDAAVATDEWVAAAAGERDTPFTDEEVAELLVEQMHDAVDEM